MPSTNLFKACKSNDLQLLKKTLQAGNNPNQRDHWGRYPVYYAMITGSYQCFEALVATGKLDLTLESKVTGQASRESPLATAIRVARLEDSHFLTTILAHMKPLTSLQIRMVLKPIFKQDRVITAQFLDHLQKAGHNPRLPVDLTGYELLICQYARPEHYQLLFERNCCFNKQVALRHCLSYRKYTSFSLLLRHLKETRSYNLADLINQPYQYRTGSSQLTLLAMATVQGFLQGVKQLISAGADPALLVIHRGIQMNCLTYLLSNSNYDQETPYRQAQIVKTGRYLQRYCPINWKNSLNQTGYQIASRFGNTRLYQLIEEGGMLPP